MSATTPMMDLNETAVFELNAPPATPAEPQQNYADAFSITSFVLGIASIVSGWTFVAPILGLVFGLLALRRQTKERTLALWGVWLNAAMLVLTVLLFAGLALVMMFGLFAGAIA